MEGLSQIMRRSVDDTDQQNTRHLIDDDDALHHYNEIKEAFRVNFNTFDDLLQKMGAPKMLTETNVVTYRDFEAVVRSMTQGAKYSI